MRRVLFARNTAGSVEHYYHFFFAVLVPLLDRVALGTLYGGSVIRSCGPMDRHLQRLHDLGLAELRRFELDHFRQLVRRVPRHFVELLPSQELYDADGVRPEGYRPDVLTRVRELGRATFAGDVPARDVLLVRRGEPAAFYLDGRAEIESGGRRRRSIPNVEALAEALRAHGREVDLVQLEEMDLAEQVAAFASHRLVVAQHGAALSNVLWMRPGARVVEIVPVQQGRREHFSRLAAIVGVEHLVVDQADHHAAVDPRHVVRAARARGAA